MHRLVDAVRGEVPAETCSLVDEMVEANESPIALDTLSEVLAERSAVVAPEVISEFGALAAQLGLGSEVASRLTR
jgi:hypothetical protein